MVTVFCYFIPACTTNTSSKQMQSIENKKQFRKFGLINIAAMLVLYFVYVISHQFVPATYFSPMIPYIILFFTAFNLITFHYKLRINLTRNNRFINIFLILNSLKMVVFISIIAIYANYFRDDAINFAISFFICYAVFTFLLIRSFNMLQKGSHNPPTVDDQV
jgi:hypothetical protein